eukprot:TRINITY_DN5337_c0_g1_i3.p1 TRINITY_DN5337_c0_g1~~TRINITY_DN5337_c0_g1_i3.p1  ORF type:complete len:644 (-),score=147.08 TRINITY_DN5337_c0_g1_i3:896-2827(-)
MSRRGPRAAAGGGLPCSLLSLLSLPAAYALLAAHALGLLLALLFAVAAPSPLLSLSPTAGAGDVLALTAARAAALVILLHFFAQPAKTETLAPEEAGAEQPHAAAASAARRRHAVTAAVFAVCTLCQVYVGVKCVVAPGLGVVCAALLGLQVIVIDAELWLAHAFLQEVSEVSEASVLLPALHHHALMYDGTTAGHTCDLCRQRLREAYRCQQCDFDLCLQCFEKKDKSRAENLLRGDAGVKEEKVPSNLEFLLKTLCFVESSRHLLFAAAGCLLVTSFAGLLLPNFQGKVLDGVIREDVSAFHLNVLGYVVATVISGVFGSVRNLCFSLVGSRMSNAVRNRFFVSIITQDIAFFDGTTTGDITSRLYGDSMAMVQPTQSVISTLVSSSISLVGGLIMCLYTSWRLSILAFTTVGPIIIVTKVYANWSQQINKEIWAAWGDANSNAVQAITNVRTVRAFSTEFREIAKYTTATAEALAKGIKDAYASAGTVAITNSVDLAVGVLLLWYGGSVALFTPELLTVGKLVTFQLYWGMVNNSYTSLINQVALLTRAGGAAQRVLGLLDNLPDINPNSGALLPAGDSLRGDIDVCHVSFFYQMRPDNVVLKDVSLHVEHGKVKHLKQIVSPDKIISQHLFVMKENIIT